MILNVVANGAYTGIDRLDNDLAAGFGVGCGRRKAQAHWDK